MVAAQNDKEDKEDKDDEKEDPVEIDVDSTTAEDIMTVDIDEDELPFSDDDNATEIPEELDIDCTCDGSTISCSNPSDYTACACEDGDVICMDEIDTVSDAPVEVPVETEEAPVAAMEDEPPAPDMQAVISGATSSPTVVSMAISAAGIAAAAALN